MIDKLKPCPFCGGEAKISEPCSTSYGRYWFSVGCPKCPQVELFDREEFYHTEDGKYLLKYPEKDCVERWNMRTETLAAKLAEFVLVLSADKHHITETVRRAALAVITEYEASK